MIKPIVDNKKLTFIIVAVILLVGGIGFWYWLQKKVEVPKAEVPKEEGAVGTAKTISESVPEIQTNPGEKVPEINPLDRVNPFKYTNPLR
jgi:flagellar basal body-associated protein FliL